MHDFGENFLALVLCTLGQILYHYRFYNSYNRLFYLQLFVLNIKPHYLDLNIHDEKENNLRSIVSFCIIRTG